MSANNDNISFSLDEPESDTNVSFDMSDFLHQDDTQHDLAFSMSLDYQANYNVRQLLQICDYYGISKLGKCNKEFVIHSIVNFESNAENAEHVTRRRTLWFYINEHFMVSCVFDCQLRVVFVFET